MLLLHHLGLHSHARGEGVSSLQGGRLHRAEATAVHVPVELTRVG